MTVDTRKLIGQVDASLWAEAWCLTAREILEDGISDLVDEGWMIGWFANAIMAGFDEGYTRQKRDLARLKYALNHGWNRAQYEYACEKDLWEENELSDLLPSVERQAEVDLLTGGPLPVGDPTEYELIPSYADSGEINWVMRPGQHRIEALADVPTEHLYADEDVARVAQELEEVKDLLGDLLQTRAKHECHYDEAEWCIEHFMGRPCSVELARSYINGK